MAKEASRINGLTPPLKWVKNSPSCLPNVLRFDQQPGPKKK